MWIFRGRTKKRKNLQCFMTNLERVKLGPFFLFKSSVYQLRFIVSLLRLWSTKSGTCIKTFRGHFRRINSCAFNSSSTHAISGSNDTSLKLWKLDEEEDENQIPISLAGHTDIISSVAFSNDDSFVVCASHDLRIRICLPNPIN